MLNEYKPAADGAHDGTRGEVRRFDNVTEFLEEVEKRADRINGASRKSSYGRSWDEGVGFTGALKMGREGWAEGREKAEKLTGTLVAELHDRIQREDWIAREDGGEYVDLSRYTANEPDYWMQPEVEYAEQGSAERHVRIVLAGTCSGGIGSDTLIRRGAVVAALADLLEVGGVTVTVDVVYYVCDDRNSGMQYGHGHVASWIRVKAGNERCDLAKLMFWLAHPTAFRRLGFGYQEGYNSKIRRSFGFTPSGGYGNISCHPDLPEGEEPPQVFMSAAYYGDSQWSTTEKTTAWLADALQQLGVQVKEAA